MRCLQNEGVDLIFGYPGGAALHIYDALFQQNYLSHVLVRHEQGAVHAADGYSRATGRPGVCLVTSGPGATNAITGLATAYMDSIPVIVISGQVRSELIGTDAFQETDMIGLSRPIVKHSFLVKDPNQLALAFKQAFHIATTGRPGPVVIDVAKDATEPSIKVPFNYPEKIRMRSYNPPVSANIPQVRRAAEAIRKAKQPVIYAGGGVVLGNASAQLMELAQLCDTPVTNTLMGLGAFPGTHPRFLGMLGMHGTYEANMAMHHSDLIIAIGARFDDRVTNTPSKFAPDAQIIQIDVDTSNIGKIIQPDIPIVGPASKIMAALSKELTQKPCQPGKLQLWHKQIAEWRSQHGLNHQMHTQMDDDKPILPQTAVQLVYELTQGDAFVTSDVGQHQMFAA
ncbi:MAG: biosynthetic-type acetolactate synthase large subunit, partial [Gammaproteobacteria bacterium]